MESLSVRPHICVLGSLNIDQTVRTPRCPGPGETLTASSSQASLGGKGANQAVACGRASITSRSSQQESDALVTMIGAVGGDDQYFSSLIQPTRAASGVSTECIAQIESQNTGTAYVIVEEAAGCENRILVIPGANHSPRMNDLEGVLASIIQQQPPCDIVLLQGEIPSSTVLGILHHFNSQAQGPKVVFNPAPVFPAGIPLSALRGTAVLIMNETEAVQVLSCIDAETAAAKGTVAPEILRPKEIARRIHQLAMVQIVVITLGSKGVFYSTIDGTADLVQGVAVDAVVDTTAAGDTFVGYFAVHYAKLMTGPSKSVDHLDKLIRLAVQVANSAAAVTVQRPGASSSVPFAYELSS